MVLSRLSRADEDSSLFIQNNTMLGRRRRRGTPLRAAALLLVWCNNGIFTTGLAFAPNNFITKIIGTPAGGQTITTTKITTTTKNPTTTTVFSTWKIFQYQYGSNHLFFRQDPLPARTHQWLFASSRPRQECHVQLLPWRVCHCHLRMDDTNPSKEDKEYVNSIIYGRCTVAPIGLVRRSTGQSPDGDGGENAEEETTKLFPWDGPVRQTSDYYFEFIYECGRRVDRSGRSVCG
jgi:hypothetical protein